jgi:molybdopterin-guanine dinucleotide biosynthesis protein A
LTKILHFLFLFEENNNRLKFFFLSLINLQRSAVVLAGGFSSRFGRDKGLVVLAGKPLIVHVIDRISRVVGEVLVVVSSETQREKFEAILEEKAVLIVDKREFKSPLVGAMTGFESAQGEYSLLLPCDTPLVSTKIVQFLFDMCMNKGAAIPRWTSGYIEPLQAVYHTQYALNASKKALAQGKMNMLSMINNLVRVRYVSTMVLELMEPKLLTFLNINAPQDLTRVKSFFK